MSLRGRVLMLIGAVLAAGVLAGAAFAGWLARGALGAELRAGMDGGASTVESAFEDLPRSDHPERDLRQLVSTFDGNRHVRAVLYGSDGRAVDSSRAVRPGRSPPAWFAGLLGPLPQARALPTPPSVKGFRAIRLEPTAQLDESVLWSEFWVVAGILSLAVLVGLGLVYLAIGAALRPLDALTRSFARIGAGDYAARAPHEGPSELIALTEGFNAMAAQLAVMDNRNRHLEAQLATLQEEERADLARDLHDEIGPHLFAVNVDAEVIGHLVAEGRQPEIGERIRAIQSGVAHMQRLVRDILVRLRPTRAAELGLNAAIEDLAAFWRARSPGLDIELRLPEREEEMSEPVKDAVYRIVQEAMNNAVRHADPDRLRVKVDVHDASEVVVEVADDGGKAGVDVPASAGLGLLGMRERVRASGGSLSVDRGKSGWTVRAVLPLRQPEDA
jgi:two-component system sensor histidine kinase UhpB